MKKVKIIAFTGLIILAILFNSGYSKNSAISIQQLESNKINLIQNFDNSIECVNSNAFETNSLKISYEALEGQIGTFEDSDFLIILQDPNITSLTKNTLLQMSKKINYGNGISNSKNFKALLEKGVLDEDVRTNLIESLDAEDLEIKNILSKIAKTETGAVVMRSLIKLEQNDALMALEVSNKILDDVSKYNEDNIRAAISVKSDYFKELTMVNSKEPIDSEKKEFIKLCTSLYEKTSDDKLKDTIAFSLMNMRDFKAVKAIISNDNIDIELKIACISRNAETFINVINNSPSIEDVEFIISCMEILPLKDLAQPMKDSLLSNSNFYSHRLRNIITFIEGSGVESDTTRFERTPTSNWLE